MFSGALESELFEFDGSDIKVRALSFSNYQSGKEKIDFIHVTLKILSGRSSNQKEMLSQLVLKQLITLGLTNCSMSVEVIDIDRPSYSKVVV